MMLHAGASVCIRTSAGLLGSGRKTVSGSVRLPCAAASLLLAMVVLFPTTSFAQQITLTIATHYTDDQRAPLTACLREYEQLHPGTAIIHRQLSYRDVLQTLFMSRMSGRPPDIYNLSTAWTEQLVDSGALSRPPAPINEFVSRTYLPSTVEAMTSQGQIWGIPSETDVYMLVYNKILFARAGIAMPPGTVDEWVKDAAKYPSPTGRAS